MKDGRLHKRVALIGDTGTGKSSKIMELVPKFYDLSKQRLLIITETDTPAFNYFGKKKIRRLKSYEEFASWESGIVKFYDYENRGSEMLKLLREQFTNKVVFNGAVVFDDCTNYFPTVATKESEAILRNHRHYDLDLFFTSHTLRYFPAMLRQEMHYFLLFKTRDVLPRGANDLLSFHYLNHLEMYNAHLEARHKFAHGDPFFCKPVLTGI